MQNVPVNDSWTGSIGRRLLLGFLIATADLGWAAETQTILVYGDSISSAYGLAPEQGWVVLLAQRLEGCGKGYHVVNASRPGETTAGGASRLPRELQRHAPAWVLVELGANDGLRGLPPAQTRSNLERIVDTARKAGARVLLLGMRIPPNYGKPYADAFAESYRSVAAGHGVPLIPFLLEGIGGSPDLMQDDGLHPNAAGQRRLLDNVWPRLAALLPC